MVNSSSPPEINTSCNPVSVVFSYNKQKRGCNFLCSYWGLSGGGLCGHRPCGSTGTWPLWLPGDVAPVVPACRGLGVSCSTAPWVLCVGVDTAPVTPGVWAHVVPVCRGLGGLAVPPSCVPRGTPRPPDTRGPGKLAAFLARPRTKRSLPYVSRPGAHQGPSRLGPAGARRRPWSVE